MKDITIIGAGPVGIYASFYAGLRELSVNLIEALPYIGGQLSALYPEKIIYDLPGYSKIKAQDFIDLLKEQLDTKKEFIDIYCNEEIISIEKKDNYFELRSNNNNVFQSKTILLTCGNGVFSPRHIGIENEELYSNILYAIIDINKFKNKNITILGGGDSALDWALILKDIASNVNIVHRRDQYRAKEDSINKLNKSKVNQYMSYLVETLNGHDNILDNIMIKHKETKEVITLDLDYLIVNYGNVTKVANFGSLALEKEEFGYIVNRVFETNIDGIYACGNAINYQGKPKLITPGLGEVPIVINNIKGYIDPESKNKIFYSSASDNVVK
ncbi:MAG: NAD(P)/FAD-dependent oxidoreductase [Bacilli bacterium]|jgi:thioredoxin reductase (NADPH)|nr:NAD(P)/FAD-dependent oxidoreductase [Bacilli bacterium]